MWPPKSDNGTAKLALAVLLVGLCCVGLAAPAFGQEGEPPPVYQAGDSFIFDNGRVEIFREGDGEILHWQRLSGREFTRFPSFFVPLLEWETSQSRGRRTVTGDPSPMWPLRKGRSASFSVVTDAEYREHDESWDKAARRRSAQHWKCGVKKRRSIEVPAGEFEVYPIECKRFSVRSMRLIRKTTYYYSPDVGHYIRVTSLSYRSGDKDELSLIAALPGNRSNTTRIRAILDDWRADHDGSR